MKIAVFPGSFDPITIGHVDLIERGLNIFDQIIVAIGNNTNKKYLFDIEKRKRFIEKIFEGRQGIQIKHYDTLTVDFCKSVNARYILRGLRSGIDFEYEKTIAMLNKNLNPDIETVCLVSRPELSHISSTVVREIIMHNGKINRFVHTKIADDLQNPIF
ncbi:MAG: pantetheine-phosphate adenylyltransferase [Chitinophagaceae bacterium]|nr:MAG: pantetheine-phosphate adenylyltransferase [Chitinophagaceae bacterium]